MTFAQPLWLLLLLALPLLMYSYRREAARRHVTLQVSRMSAMQGVKTWVVYLRSWIQVLRWAAMTLLIVALARPQYKFQEEKIEAEAIDLILAIDISPSMLSKDFSPDRLSVAKQLALDFLNQRPYDQLGLVVFAGGAFTQCPLTFDRRILTAFLNNLQVGRLQDDGTAIGMGLSTAVYHLRDSKSPSRVVVLMTDGENNTGEIGPLRAAEIAKSLGVRVYIVGIGTDGTVLSPTYQKPDGSYAFANRNMVFDTQLLEQVATTTGGQFYRAQSVADMAGIYKQIDGLEKGKITKTAIVRTSERFFWMLAIAFLLLLVEMILRWGPLRVITV